MLLDPKRIEEWKQLAENVTPDALSPQRQLSEAVAALAREREELIELLREIESIPREYNAKNNCTYWRCPCCNDASLQDGTPLESDRRPGRGEQDHDWDCRLAAFLKVNPGRTP